MIKAIISITLCSLFISIGTYAQSQISEWRLVKISQVYTRDNPNTSEYIYDDWGKLKAINQYYNDKSGKKWDGTTVKDFVYNKGGYITAFTNYEATGNLQYVLDYDNKNRLIKRQIYKIAANGKTPAKKLAYVLKYSYKGNEIKESLIKPPSESVVDETTYTLDLKGNIIRMERKDMATMKVEKYTSGDFDNNPNPNLFTGAYFYTAIQSKQNGKEGYWEGMAAPEKTESVYDAQGMVKKTIITEKDENSMITSEYIYTYARIRIPSKVSAD